MADHMSSLVLGGVGRVVRASDPTAAPPFTAPSPPKKDPERALPLFSNPSPYFKEGCLTTALFVAVCFCRPGFSFPQECPVSSLPKALHLLAPPPEQEEGVESCTPLFAPP